ncbi:tumor necrosis factor receptor superfamily member 6B-like [Rhinoraja longicauda]
MILKCLVVFALIETVSSSIPNGSNRFVRPTYNWTDPRSGLILECGKCPPTTHVRRPCSRYVQTSCAHCLPEQHLRYWNSHEKCHDCTPCRDNQHETRPCTFIRDRRCECDTNYFWNRHYCQRHAKCTYGHGVERPGSRARNSTCAECPSGFFSPTVSSTDPCTAHTICQDGLVVNVPGNIYHDTLCTSCNKYVGTSVSNTACDDALIQFVAYQKIAKQKLEMFLRSLNTENVERLLGEMLDLNTNMMYTMLYPLLIKWRETVNGQPVPQLMISVLERADLNDVIAKVQSRFW